MSLPAQMSLKRKRPEGKMNDTLMTAWEGSVESYKTQGPCWTVGTPRRRERVA